MLDYNCYVGKWPFCKHEEYTFEHLKKLHRDNGIEGGYVSSVESIFYNDFYESEWELHNSIKGDPAYKHVVTANPSFPSCGLTLEKCIKDFNVHGIRLHPGYHGYTLDCEAVDEVAQIAKKYGLPLFLTNRMLDERFTHMIHPKQMTAEEITAFLEKHGDISVILSHFKFDEIMRLLDLRGNVKFDFTGIAANLISRGGRINEFFEKIVYGSGFPVYNVPSGAFHFRCEVLGMKP